MSFTTDNIPGIGLANVSSSEYTSVNLLQTYSNLVTPIAEIFSQDSSSLTAQDYDALNYQVQQLQQLAQQGVTDTTNGVSYQSYLNQACVQNLQQIMGTLGFVGIPSSGNLSDTQKVDALQLWQSLQNQGVDIKTTLSVGANMVQYLTNQTIVSTDPGTGAQSVLNVNNAPWQTFQSMLEIDYVGTANQLISQHLSSLETALSLSQQALNSFAGVQNLLNYITVPSTTSFSNVFPPTISITNGKMPEPYLDEFISFIQNNSTFAGQIMANTGGGTAFITLYKNLGGSLPWNDDQDFFNAHPNAYQSAFALVSHNRNFASALLSDFLANVLYPATGTSNLWNKLMSTGSPINQLSQLEIYKSLYRLAASGFFAQIFPTVQPANYASAARTLLATKAQLSAEYAQLQLVNPGMTPSSTNLLGGIYNVMSDITRYFGSATAATDSGTLSQDMQAWILDGQQQSSSLIGTAGAVQARLTQAITNAENLEQTQQEDVKNYVQVFQQFYQTTSALLQMLQQLFDKIGQNIDGQ